MFKDKALRKYAIYTRKAMRKNTDNIRTLADLQGEQVIMSKDTLAFVRALQHRVIELEDLLTLTRKQHQALNRDLANHRSAKTAHAGL